MTRSARLAALMAVIMALSAGVVSRPALAMECGPMLDKASAAVSAMASASPEKRAALRRMAMTGYDHCMAGDVSAAEKVFAMVMSGGNQR